MGKNRRYEKLLVRHSQVETRGRTGPALTFGQKIMIGQHGKPDAVVRPVAMPQYAFLDRSRWFDWEGGPRKSHPPKFPRMV